MPAVGRKRGRTPSMALQDSPEAKTPGKRKAKASEQELSVPDEKPQAIKRSRRSVTPGLAAASASKREGPTYVVKKGMNALPTPIPAVTKAILKASLASKLSAGLDITSDDIQKLAQQPPIVPREMFVFGNGDMGQHGLGTDVLDEIKRPRRHVGIAKLVEEGKLGPGGLEYLAAGGMHTLAIDSTGQIYSWGINDNACLGRQTTRQPGVDAEVFETQPLPVEGLSPSGIGTLGGPLPLGGTQGPVEQFRATRVAAGDSVSAALNERGEVRVWGSFRSNDGLMGFDGTEGSDKTQFLPVALPALTKHSFVQIACGSDHVLALSTEGIVFSWGNGQQGQLGRRIIERRKINGLTPERLMLKNVVSIGACSYHSFAIDKRGDVWAWGLNTLSQLGVATSQDTVTMPTRVPSLSPGNLDGARVVQAHGGQHHSLFLLSDGRVFGCGRCDGFELGIDEAHPAMKEVVDTRNEWAARRDEELKSEMAAWEKRMAEKRASQAGPGGGGPTGADMIMSEEDMPPRRGPPPDEYIQTPVHIPFPNNARIVSLSCGARHNLAVDEQGVIYSWGFGVTSQLGHGDEEQMETPTVVRSKQLAAYSTVAAQAGGQHCVLLAASRGEEAEAETAVKTNGS